MKCDNCGVDAAAAYQVLFARDQAEEGAEPDLVTEVRATFCDPCAPEPVREAANAKALFGEPPRGSLEYILDRTREMNDTLAAHEEKLRKEFAEELEQFYAEWEKALEAQQANTEEEEAKDGFRKEWGTMTGEVVDEDE